MGSAQQSDSGRLQLLLLVPQLLGAESDTVSAQRAQRLKAKRSTKLPPPSSPIPRVTSLP